MGDTWTLGKLLKCFKSFIFFFSYIKWGYNIPPISQGCEDEMKLYT